VEAGGTFVPADTLIRFVLHQRSRPVRCWTWSGHSRTA
jgi:hypothetical protein